MRPYDDDDEQFQTMVPNKKTLSDGISACSGVFFLDQISQDTREYPRLPIGRVKRRLAFQTDCRIYYCRQLLSFLVGFLSVVFMLDLVIMYAMGLRSILTLLIVIVIAIIGDSTDALWRITLMLWPLVYCGICFNRITESCTKFAMEIFKFLNARLETKISDVMRMSEQFQLNTGFKYFTHNRMEELAAIAHRLRDSDSECDFPVEDNVHSKDAYSRYFVKDKLKVSKTGQPYWHVNNLVLFIGKQDVPRIPTKLFWKICNELNAPGCPGPLRHGMRKGFKQLLYMLVFLFVVLAILNMIVEVIISSDSGQFLVTMVGGIVPYMLSEVLVPKESEVDLSSYSLQGKIEEILLDYHQKWPAYDIVGKVARDHISTP